MAGSVDGTIVLEELGWCQDNGNRSNQESVPANQFSRSGGTTPIEEQLK